MRCLLALGLLAALAAADDTRTHALCVGCTEYPNLKSHRFYRTSIRLPGAERDAALIAEVFRERLGVAPGDLTLLAGWPDDEAKRPTRANILGHLDRLAREVKKGDRAIFYFAGHGSQEPDDDGDELDGMDEILLPSDVSRWISRKRRVPEAIKDDELGRKLRAIRDKGATVWLVLDCCHSGTAARGEPVGRKRGLDPSLLGVPAGRARGGADGTVRLGGDDLRGIAATYAAQSFREAMEFEFPLGDPNGEPHGVLTWVLSVELRRSGGDLTFRELQARLVNGYHAIPCDGTMPLAEGDLSLRVHGGGRSPHAPLLVRREDGQLVLNAGRMAGFEKGARLAVFRPGRRGDDGARLGFVEIEDAGLVRSVCRGVDLPELAGELAVCPALLVESPVGDYRLRVFLEEHDAETEAAFAQGQPAIVRVRPRGHAEWLLLPRDGGGYWLQPALGGESARLPVATGELYPALRRLFRAQNLKRFAARGGLPAGLEVKLLRNGEPVPHGGALRPGDVTEIEIRNGTGARYDVTVLMVDANAGVQCFYPGFGLPRLDHVDKRPLRLGPFDITDDSLGVEHLLVLAVPRREEDETVDLGWLAQSPVITERAPPKTEAGRFLGALAFGRTERGPARDPDAVHAGLLTWRTTWGEIGPPRRFSRTVAPVVTTRHCARALAAKEREAWEPASLVKRYRGDLSALYQKVGPAVVVVRTRVNHGSGFVVDAKKGLVLTNRHVVAQGYGYSPAGRRQVFVHRGDLDAEGVMRVRHAAATADIVAQDAERDLALLHVSDPTFFEGVAPIALAPEKPKPGGDAVILGHPASGMLWSLREGRVSAVGAMPYEVVDNFVALLALEGPMLELVRTQLLKAHPVRIVLSTCGANPGDSGGPLFDREGRLLGVTFAIPSRQSHADFVYHVHVDEVKAFLAEEVAEGPDVPDPWELGPMVDFLQSDAQGPFDVLVAGETAPAQVLIDIEGDSKVDFSDPAGVAQVVAMKSFDWEACFHQRDDRRLAFYDTDNDGQCDLVLIDDDDDDDADVRFTRTDKGWVVETDIAAPWLSASYLKFEKGEELALKKFHVMTR